MGTDRPDNNVPQSAIYFVGIGRIVTIEISTPFPHDSLKKLARSSAAPYLGGLRFDNCWKAVNIEDCLNEASLGDTSKNVNIRVGPGNHLSGLKKLRSRSLCHAR